MIITEKEKMYNMEIELIRDLYRKTDEKVKEIEKEFEKHRSYFKKPLYLIVTLVPILTWFGFSSFGTLRDNLSGDIKTVREDISSIRSEIISFRQEISLAKEDLFEAKEMLAEARIEVSEARSLSDESNKINADSKKVYIETKNLRRSADALSEIVLRIQRIVRDSKLDQEVKTIDLENLQDMTIQYQLAMRNIYKKYIEIFSNSTNLFAPDIKNLDYEAVFESILTFLKLIEYGKIEINEEEIGHIIPALIFVLTECDKEKWDIQRTCRDFITSLLLKLKELKQPSYEEWLNYLSGCMYDESRNERFKWNISLILSRFHVKDEHAIRELENGVKLENEPWVSAASAIGLIKLGKPELGWSYINRSIVENDKMAKGMKTLSVLLLLAQHNRNELKIMGFEEKFEPSKNVDKYELLGMLLKKKCAARFRDQYSKTYLEKLLIENLQVKF
jgi:hypothetical protein